MFEKPVGSIIIRASNPLKMLWIQMYVLALNKAPELMGLTKIILSGDCSENSNKREEWLKKGEQFRSFGKGWTRRKGGTTLVETMGVGGREGGDVFDE